MNEDYRHMEAFDGLSGEGPLDGVVVIEAGTMISSGTIGRLLSDFGATVIKTEHPEMGDPLRDLQPKKGDCGLWWKYLGRNKKAITLDLSEERGQVVLKDLVEEADVLVENFRPGTFERWNLGYDRLEQVNPELVMVRVSGFGQTGPYSDRPGFGTLAEAMSGFAYINGFPDGPPLLPKTGFADGIAALFSVSAIMYALYHREVNGGSGQCIDTSLIEPIFSILGPQPLQYDQLGEVEKRSGNRSTISAPRNVYQTADGRWVAVSASTQSVAARMFEAIGRPDLLEDPRFSDNASRVDNVEALDEVVQSWFADRSREEVLEVLGDSDVPAAPIYNVAEIMNEEHYRERNAVITVEDDELGDARVQNTFPKFSETPGSVEYLGPDHGEHNDLIYGEFLDYDEQLREELREEGII